MHKEKYDTKKIIRIILDYEYNIHYSSINSVEAYNYLKKLHIFNKLSEASHVQYFLENYWVDIDEINIADQKYYLITIDSSNYECSECSKVLVDSVTGLYNRNYWEQINNCPINHNLYSTKDLSLIFIDIDNLKEINDNLGHLAGDEVIKIVGQAIKKSIRKEDLGVRYGGDEFIILFFNQDKKETKKITERIRKEINKLAKEHGLNIQISAGIACSDCLVDLEDMIKIADKNLYEEKRIKKHLKIKNRDLRTEIEKIRKEFNRVLVAGSQATSNEKILEISKDLDELILKYLSNVR